MIFITQRKGEVTRMKKNFYCLFVLIVLVITIFIAVPTVVSNANAKTLEEELRDKMAEYMKCVEEKGEAQCDEIFKQVISLTYQLKEKYETEYSLKCKGELAGSRYCRELARKIKELLIYLYEKTCKGATAQSEYCKQLKKEIEEWETKERGAKSSTPKVSPPGTTPQEQGGVYIDPKPVKAGKGGSETKKKVLESRLSDNTLYWDVK